MESHVLLYSSISLLPAVTLLATLVWLDSYKLVRPLAVVALLAGGAAAAAASYELNAWALPRLGMGLAAFSRYVSPVTEEILKASIVIVLILRHRIGFLIDAAICGFAVGTGFALAENFYFLETLRGAGAGTWIVRGFGTAIMHGGATATAAVMGIAMLESRPGEAARAFLPGLALAVVLHSAFNHLLVFPRVAMAATVVGVPLLLVAVFWRSDRAIGDWLGRGFDADAEMLELLNSGRFADSPVGRYLADMRQRFKGPVVADLLCYLRLYTELALRAKGILMMRESGFEVEVDDDTREKFAEMEYLEKSIGATGLLALHPLLHGGRRNLWQLYVLGK